MNSWSEFTSLEKFLMGAMVTVAVSVIALFIWKITA